MGFRFVVADARDRLQGVASTHSRLDGIREAPGGQDRVTRCRKTLSRLQTFAIVIRPSVANTSAARDQ
jgi:hypothetical protein